ncbi:nitroreductase family protein [Streptomyces sp. NPDC001941]|uniref:nitroreductase family protein n=1 Tax=Streptomyces sp. NPDC001941 TaxID=3154659 RepID=UPI00331E0EAD
MNSATAARGGIPVAAMSDAVRTDPQFRLPVRPSLCRGLHLVDTPEGLLIDGAAERQQLRGASAALVRSRLLPLLDGTRDAAALARETGWSPRAVGDALAVLYFAGVLEDAAAEVEPEGQPPSEQAALWFSRTLDCSRVHPHSSHAALAAGQAVVRHLLPPARRAPLRDALRDLGTTDVACLATDDAGPLPDDAVVVVDLGAPAELAGPLLAECAERGLRVLLVSDEPSWEAARETGVRDGASGAGPVRDGDGPRAGSGTALGVGPYVEPGATACLECARRALPVTSEGWPASVDAARPSPDDLLAAALVAEELRALLVRNEPAATLGARLVVDPAAGSTSVAKLTPEPDCPRCYPTGAGRELTERAAAPLHYEAAVAFPPRHLVNPKAHQHHFRPENVGLQFDRLRYPNNPSLPLPPVAPGVLDAPPADSGPAAWALRIAALLRFGTGLRDAEEPRPRRLSRWAPTGGNLGSPHAYLLASGVPGLPDGVHYYDAGAHALTAMHPHTRHLAELTRDLPTGAPDEPLLLLVLAGELHRVARKYGPFSYRVAHLDAGCALAQLALIAQELGLGFLPLDPAPWQQRRERVVGVSGPAAITAAVRITPEGSTPCR